MAGSYDGSIRISTRVDNSGFNRGLQEQNNLIQAQNAKVNGYWNQTATSGQQAINGLSSGMSSLMGAVGKLAIAVGAVFAVAAPLIKLGQQAIDLASNIQEVDNVVSKAFGNMRGEMDALADTAIEKLGMSRLTAYQTGSTFMSMGKSMVDSMEDAKNMALELTKKTANMSSFFNVDQSVASTALKSIYTGETETLKQFGVVMTEVNLQQFAYEQGIRKSLAAMTQSEKVMLRYHYVMEQLAYIGNDFEDTQASWANQTRILAEQWKELLSILGGGLMEVLTPVVQGLNAIVAALIDMAKSVGDVITIFRQIKSDQMDEVVSSTSAATDAMNEYGNAIEAAEEKASKLAAFDDLNVLASDEDSNSGTTTVPVLNVEEQKQATEELEEKVSDLQEKLQKGFNQGLVTKKTKEDVNKNLSSIGSSAANIFKGPELQNAMQEFKDSTVETLGTVVGSAESIGLSVGTGVTGGIKDALEDPELQSFATDKLTDTFGSLVEVQEDVQGLATAFAEMATAFESEGFSNLIEFFTKLETFTNLTALETFSGFAADLVDLFASPITENSEAFTEMFENIFELFSNLTEPAKEVLDLLIGSSSSYEDSWLHKVMQELSGENSEYTKTRLEEINGVLEELIALTEGLSLDNFEEWWAGIGDLFKEKIEENIEDIKTNWLSFEKWKEMLAKPRESFEEWWSGIVGWWKEKLTLWSSDNEDDWFSKERWDGMLENVGDSFGDWWTGVVNWWCEELPAWWDEEVAPWFTKEKWLEILDNVIEAAGQMWDDSFGKISEELPKWWDEKVAPWFTKEKWQELGKSMKDGIYEGFKSAVYKIIDILNGIINAAQSGINGLIDSLNSFVTGYNNAVPSHLEISPLGKVNFGSIPYPKLAQGAVIPPNHQFLAVLGDQTSGTNIEAPLSTIQEALQNVYDQNQGSGAQEVTIRFEGTMSQLVRAMKPYIIAEQKRTGKSFRIDEGGGLI